MRSSTSTRSPAFASGGPSVGVHSRRLGPHDLGGVKPKQLPAQRIGGARLVDPPGVDHDLWVGDSERVLGVVERFPADVAATPASAR